MARQAIVASCLLALAGCGGSSSTPTPTAPAPIPAADACNVLGGSATTPGTAILNGSSCAPDRSSVVLLNMRSESGSGIGACSGTIIGPRAILTAAHCVDDNVPVVRAWLGPPHLEISASGWVYYPNYVFNRPDVYDVAVVFVNEDLGRPAFPILTSRAARAGETAILAGWGRDQFDAGATLRAGSTTINAVGSSLLETLYRPPSSSVCSGDSGGPILLQEGGVWAIGGIASATSANVCNTGTNYHQAVRHPSALDFILQHVPAVAQR